MLVAYDMLERHDIDDEPGLKTFTFNPEIQLDYC